MSSIQFLPVKAWRRKYILWLRRWRWPKNRDWTLSNLFEKKKKDKEIKAKAQALEDIGKVELLPNFTIDYPKVMYSQGKLALPDDITVATTVVM